MTPEPDPRVRRDLDIALELRISAREAAFEGRRVTRAMNAEPPSEILSLNAQILKMHNDNLRLRACLAQLMVMLAELRAQLAAPARKPCKPATTANREKPKTRRASA